MPFPTLERLQLAEGEASLTWFGRFAKRVGPTQEAHFGLMRLGRIPLFLETVAVQREGTVQREWIAFSINLLSPCCLWKLEGEWKSEEAHCTAPRPNREDSTCGRVFPVLLGRTVLSGDGARQEVALTTEALAQWAEQFDYDPLSAVLLASAVNNLGLRSLDEPRDLEPMTYAEAQHRAASLIHRSGA